MTSIPYELRSALARVGASGWLSMVEFQMIDNHVPNYLYRLAKAMLVDPDQVVPMIGARKVQTAPALAALVIEVGA